jgi:FkbM family methyltransferase
MPFLTRLRRRFQKKFFPTERDQVMRRWRADQGDDRLRLDYDLSPASVVFDLGGYEGNWAHQIHQRYGCRVCVFEPVREYADLIARRFSGNQKIEVFPYGLAAATRLEKIGLCSDSSSVFRASGQTQEIRLVDAAAWFSEQQIKQVALMKINIEGGEYELLERLIQAGIIPQIDNIQVQFHEIAPDSPTRMAAIQHELQRTHVPTYQYKFVWENWCRRGLETVQG